MKHIKVLLLSFVGIMLLLCSVSFAERVTTMRVRQSAFNLEFQVYRTNDMPANWFKTYDDFYVTRRMDNNWVYGKRTINGMEITDIIVGTVDPVDVPELNEAYTDFTVDATPIYMPPLPPGMRSEANKNNVIAQLPQTKTGGGRDNNLNKEKKGISDYEDAWEKLASRVKVTNNDVQNHTNSMYDLENLRDKNNSNFSNSHLSADDIYQIMSYSNVNPDEVVEYFKSLYGIW